MLCYPFPTDNFKKYTKKTNPKITILEILVYKIQPEIMESLRVSALLQSHFVIKLERVEKLEFIISGCILHTKISRMVICGKWITQHIGTKLPCQKLLLKPREWGVQNETIR